MSANDSLGEEIAGHYNNIKNNSISERKQSHIIHLRRFNNAMKALLIDRAINMLNKFPNVNKPYRILELGCGKGGDLKKYLRYNVSKHEKVIDYFCGYDIAATSIEHCRLRHQQMNDGNRMFKADFNVADLSKVDIPEAKPDKKFHIVSAQFCIHYSFESYAQANRFIGNAAKNVAQCCFFIGTYPDGARLVKLARQSGECEYSIGDILQVKFDKNVLDNPKPFGSKYHFKLKEVVDCPEFLVHPTVLKQMLGKNGLSLVSDLSFHDFFNEHLKGPFSSQATEQALRKIFIGYQGLSYVPPNSENDDEYSHIHEKAEDVGTMPRSMWLATSIYRVFIARKS